MSVDPRTVITDLGRLRLYDVRILGLLDVLAACTPQYLLALAGQELASRDVHLSDATLERWWQDARARQLVEPHPQADLVAMPLYVLSDRGAAHLRRRRLLEADGRELMSARSLSSIAKWLLPAGALTAAVIVLTARSADPAAIGTMLGWLLGLLVAALAVGTICRLAMPVIDRVDDWMLASVADVLEGRQPPLLEQLRRS